MTLTASEAFERIPYRFQLLLERRISRRSLRKLAYVLYVLYGPYKINTIMVNAGFE
jgi:hypothetical protein